MFSSSVIFGLLSALSWGGGDFSGGLASKRASPYAVVLGGQFTGALLLTLLALIFGEALPALATPWQSFGLPMAAGISGAIGLVALYTGLANGAMGVVAPVSGVVGAAVPIGVAALTEGSPGLLPLLGFALALLAVWLLSGGAGGGLQRSGLLAALVAGLGFGFYFVFMALATAQATWWPLVVGRCASMLLVTVVMALTAARGGRVLLPAVTLLPLVALSGILDTGGNLFYTLAAQAGRMDTAAVISSLYPAATVGLAWLLLHERLSATQWVGVALGLLAIPLIAA